MWQSMVLRIPKFKNGGRKMKLTRPVDVDLFRFIINGEFDYIETGQTKEWILNNFPEPDQIADMGNDLYIWLYGSIEFHFDGEILFNIWCDNFQKFTAGRNINLNKWIFDNVSKVTVSKMISILNQNKLNFTLVHKYESVIIRVLSSNVDLYFSPEYDENYTNTDTDNLCLSAFGLSHADYRQKLDRHLPGK